LSNSELQNAKIRISRFDIYFFNLSAIKPIFGQNEVHRVAKKFEGYFLNFLFFLKWRPFLGKIGGIFNNFAQKWPPF